MKKREKFLLAFIISWCVVMSVFVARSIKTTRYYSLHVKELKEWLSEGPGFAYDNLTEEAKEYFKNQIKEREETEKISEKELAEYCEEYSDFCEYMETEEYKIEEAAGEYWRHNIIDQYGEAVSFFEDSLLLIENALYTMMLTLVIYAIMTLEFKNKKQYILDSLKLVLALIVLIIIAGISICLLGFISGFDKAVGAGGTLTTLEYFDAFLMVGTGYIGGLVEFPQICAIALLLVLIVKPIVRRKNKKED